MIRSTFRSGGAVLAYAVMATSAFVPWTAASAQQRAQAATAPAPNNKIDELVFAQLQHANLQPAPLSTDAVLLRRAYVDVIGDAADRCTRRARSSTTGVPASAAR